MSGKNYAISDIHGMYELYNEAVKSLKPEDTLFIIGDVIDRGSRGIEIIQDIMKRKKGEIPGPQIEYLLGNHEVQFIKVLKILKSHNIGLNEWKTVYKGCVVKNLNEDESMTDWLTNVFKENSRQAKNFEKDLNRYEILNKEKKLDYYDENLIYTWTWCNDGAITLTRFFDLSQEERTEMFRFLDDLPVMKSKTIQDNKFLFVHSKPTLDVNILGELAEKDCEIKYKDSRMNDYMILEILAERDRVENSYLYAKELGFTTICGHIPSLGIINCNSEKGFIRIDSGCFLENSKSKLARFCIEDKRAEYFGSKRIHESITEVTDECEGDEIEV